jgi:hypothetical protein
LKSGHNLVYKHVLLGLDLFSAEFETKSVRFGHWIRYQQCLCTVKLLQLQASRRHGPGVNWFTVKLSQHAAAGRHPSLHGLAVQYHGITPYEVNSASWQAFTCRPVPSPCRFLFFSFFAGSPCRFLHIQHRYPRALNPAILRSL